MKDLPRPSLNLSNIDPASLTDPQALERCVERLLENVLEQMSVTAGEAAWSQLPVATRHTLVYQQYIAETARGFLASIDNEDRDSVRQFIVRELIKMRR